MTTPRKDCKKCMNAVVGRHQLCRCEVDLVRAKHGGWETERI